MPWIKKTLTAGLFAGLLLSALLFIPLPVFAIKAMVLSAPEQFIVELGQAGTPSLLKRAVEYRLQVELQRHLSRERDGKSGIDKIRDQVGELRATMFTQRQILDVDVNWGGSAAQALVRGYGFCDQINGALALAVAPDVQDAGLFALNNGYRSPHSLVRLQSDKLGEIYVDAWADVPAFQTGNSKIADIPDVASVLSGYAQNIPMIDRRYVENGFVTNRYDSISRLKKIILRVAGGFLPFVTEDKVPTAADFRTPDQLESPKPTGLQPDYGAVEYSPRMSDVPGPPDIGLVNQYLEARIDHIFGNIDAALDGYRSVSASGCANQFCYLAGGFVRRLQEDIL